MDHELDPALGTLSYLPPEICTKIYKYTLHLTHPNPTWRCASSPHAYITANFVSGIDYTRPRQSGASLICASRKLYAEAYPFLWSENQFELRVSDYLGKAPWQEKWEVYVNLEKCNELVMMPLERIIEALKWGRDLSLTFCGNIGDRDVEEFMNVSSEDKKESDNGGNEEIVRSEKPWESSLTWWREAVGLVKECQFLKRLKIKVFVRRHADEVVIRCLTRPLLELSGIKHVEVEVAFKMRDPFPYSELTNVIEEDWTLNKEYVEYLRREISRPVGSEARSDHGVEVFTFPSRKDAKIPSS